MMGVVFLVEGVIFLVAKGIHSDVLMKNVNTKLKHIYHFTEQYLLFYSSISNTTAKINRNSKFSVLIFNS